ncbi:MAG: hypothetical protein WCT20_05640, partial [Candidatus Babeliales bacterium]
ALMQISLPKREQKAPQPFHKRALDNVKWGLWRVASNEKLSVGLSSLLFGLTGFGLSSYFNYNGQKTPSVIPSDQQSATTPMATITVTPSTTTGTSTGDFISSPLVGLGVGVAWAVLSKFLFERLIAPLTAVRIFADTEFVYNTLLFELKKDINLDNLKSPQGVVLYCYNKYISVEQAKTELRSKQRAAQMIFQATLKGIDQARYDKQTATEEGLMELKKNITRIFAYITQKLDYIIEYEKQERLQAKTDKKELNIKGLPSQTPVAVMVK